MARYLTLKTMEQKIEELKELECQRKTLDDQIDTLKDELKKEMSRRKTEDIDIGQYHMRYIEVMRKDFDSKKFAAEHPKLAEQYLKSSSYRRFLIT